MLTEFLMWWVEQLRSLAPAALRPGRTDHADRALAAVLQAVPANGPAAVELLARRRGGTTPLGRFTLDPAGIAALRAVASGLGQRPFRAAGRKLVQGARSAPTVLVLPRAMLLEQQVVLPLAAERELDRVLHYEMDRLTPFPAAELFWSAVVERRDRARGRLHLRLGLVPRVQLEPVLGALAQAGIRPTLLEAGPDWRMLLERPATGAWRHGPALAGAACALMAVGAAGAPFLTQWVMSRRVEQQIAALRPAVGQVEALRRTIAANAAGTDVIATQRNKVGDALGTLALLTDLLPDDTYLNDLAIRSRVVTMSGQSAAAARLIATLAADPGIRSPSFAAPVTRNQDGREGFSIKAEVVP